MMLRTAGLEQCRYHNLMGGIVARASRLPDLTMPSIVDGVIDRALHARRRPRTR